MVHHCGFKECKGYRTPKELKDHIQLVHKAPRNPHKRRKLRHTSEFARLIAVAANALREFNIDEKLSPFNLDRKIRSFGFVPIEE